MHENSFLRGSFEGVPSPGGGRHYYYMGGQRHSKNAKLLVDEAVIEGEQLRRMGQPLTSPVGMQFIKQVVNRTGDRQR